MPQDLPPAGGYEAVQYKVSFAHFICRGSEQPQADQAFWKQRNIPIRGLRPVWYLVGCAAIMAYGWRKVFLGNREKKYVRSRSLIIRLLLLPSAIGAHPTCCAMPRQTLRSTLSPHPPPAPERPTFKTYTSPLTTSFFFFSSELGREKMWSRIYITPLLQAEEDRDQARRYFADQAREKELLGSTSSPYNSDRYESLRFLPAGYVSGREGKIVAVVLGGMIKMENEWILIG